MKKVIHLSLLLGCMLLAASCGKTVKVIAIGNSFSNDAVLSNLHELSESAGRKLDIGNLYIGGCSLERHHLNMVTDSAAYEYTFIPAKGERTVRKGTSLKEALTSRKWDIVTFQQNSGNSGIPETYEPYLGELIQYVRENCPNRKARLMFHQTWAYSNYAVHKEFPKYGSSCAKMYKAIMDASSKACEKYGLEVIPSGTAIQNLRGSNLVKCSTRDGYHLHYGAGRYTAACTWFESIFGEDVTGNPYSNRFTHPDHVKVCQAAAHAACQKPFETTDLGFSVKTPNYDVSKIPAYTIPDALTMNDGTKVTTKEQWMEKRRPEVYAMFEEEMFGKAPGKPEGMHFKQVSEDRTSLGGKATRKEVDIFFTEKDKNPARVLMYIPNKANGPVPAFLGYNFKGNWATSDDPGISETFSTNKGRYSIVEPSQRGEQARRWPYETIIDAGYAVVTLWYYDVDPDYDDGFNNGVHGMFPKGNNGYPADNEWASIAAWSWGLSRVLDYLETDPAIDAGKVAVLGHSRLGKTALWAGASDQRFAVVISNDSGCGGAALSRRRIGETLEIIQVGFPHWFCRNFRKYMDNEDALPFDQHELIALAAPRPVYVASASEDDWADPEGEGISAGEAQKVYDLFGFKDRIGRHVREGRHDILVYDWKHYIEFADRFLK